MSKGRTGVYICINGSLERVACFKHMTDREWTESHEKTAPKGRVYTVKCKDCGGSGFNNDGRFVNEFSCESCVESYTEVYFYKV